MPIVILIILLPLCAGTPWHLNQMLVVGYNQSHEQGSCDYINNRCGPVVSEMYVLSIHYFQNAVSGTDPWPDAGYSGGPDQNTRHYAIVGMLNAVVSQMILFNAPYSSPGHCGGDKVQRQATRQLQGLSFRAQRHGRLFRALIYL